jgi:diamine N-acetyltransferase
MNIELIEINKENLDAVLRLDIKKEQAGFVASNAKSIAQSKYHPGFVPLAVYDDEIPVGFVMYGLDDTDDTMWIIRMMIDKNFQGKGIGKEALKKTIQRITSRNNCTEVFLSFEPENHIAKKLYESFGFEDTGRIEEGEIVYKLKLN